MGRGSVWSVWSVCSITHTHSHTHTRASSAHPSRTRTLPHLLLLYLSLPYPIPSQPIKNNMSTQQEGGAAGCESAPEGKECDGQAPGGAAAEGKVGWEGSGDPGELIATARYDTLEGMMKEDAFDTKTTPCGPRRRCALDFALGEKGDPYDKRPWSWSLVCPAWTSTRRTK